MDCPKCKIGDYVKDGKLRGLQRYKCKRLRFRMKTKLLSSSLPAIHFTSTISESTFQP